MSETVATSRAAGATLLESILFLMEPEQRTEFLATAGAAGVVYANRAPVFQILDVRVRFGFDSPCVWVSELEPSSSLSSIHRSASGSSSTENSGADDD